MPSSNELWIKNFIANSKKLRNCQNVEHRWKYITYSVSNSVLQLSVFVPVLTDGGSSKVVRWETLSSKTGSEDARQPLTCLWKLSGHWKEVARSFPHLLENQEYVIINNYLWLPSLIYFPKIDDWNYFYS